jgi:Zn-dependent protease with chaperone function
MRNVFRKQVRTLLTSLILALFLGCATKNIVQAPTGRIEVQPAAFNQYTPEQDIEIGRQAVAEVNRQMPVLPDSNPVSKYVQQLGQQLAAQAPGPVKWPFSFRVVNIKEINAFALPGGPIYIHVGTIQAADDEGQLAGVIAHEISHVVLRHSTQQASKAAFAQLPLAVLGATIGQGAAGQIAQLGASFGVQSLFLKYSRDAEREADLLGSQIMYDAGYNPFSMVEFFTKLEKEGGAGGPQFLSDHPNPGNRVELVRQAISKYPRKTYRRNSSQFEQTKSAVAKMHPLTMQQVAQQQKQQPQGQIGEINPQDVMPSGQFRNMDHSAFQISYPDNWQVAGDANSAVTIAPSAGVAQNAIAYGVIINGVRPQSGRDSLDQATQDLLSSLQQSNPGLRVASNPQDIQLNGAPGKSVYLAGTSPLQGQRERDWLVTLQRRDNTVLYLVFIAPERDFGRLAPAFEQMLRSLRIK